MIEDKVIVTITPEAAAAVRAAAANDFDDSEMRKRDDGRFDIILQIETLMRLKQMHFPGETVSDTIIRAVAVMRGQTRN